MAAYVGACATEIERALDDGQLPPATSVFVGGGTPSRLPAPLLAQVLEAVPLRPGGEVTVECNPEDASAARFETWVSAGVTRVSFGVQSTAPHVLRSLGRRHGTTEAARAVALAAQSGVDEVSVDLIFGAAVETDDDFVNSLEDVLALDPRPNHVSAYALTVEPGTPLAADEARHPDEDAAARRYALAEEVLSAAGYRWYEVSNWALPGHECRHNRLYWSRGDYRGIGCAAHSHGQGRRWWNVHTPERYIGAIRAGRSPVAGEEVLSPDEAAFESLALALRTSTGVPASVVPHDPDLDGLLERGHERAVLTVRGRLLANEVTLRLATQRPWSRGAPGSSACRGAVSAPVTWSE
jgi:oxygen-independent coproporphyrinogen-3 oxidase